jgi:hypothetical protein
VERTRSTTHVSCPTAVVEAPVQIVWELLTHPGGWGAFFDVRIVSVTPAGPAMVGQIVRAESGPKFLKFGLTFQYLKIDASPRRLLLKVELPFGITVREDLQCVSLDADRCRVNYGCNFEFPRGWRGVIARRVMRREIEAGPADSLSRLKRMAERVHEGSRIASAPRVAQPHN